LIFHGIVIAMLRRLRLTAGNYGYYDGETDAELSGGPNM
jgi:hypothetical protein